MNADQAAIYHRARAAGQRAIDAARIARWDPQPLPATLDGFDLTVTDRPDEYGSLDDLGYGEFLRGDPSDETGYTVRPHPDAVPNPYRDSRNQSGGREWYVPAVTLRESAAYFRSIGYAKGPAWDQARTMIGDELHRVTWDYGPDVRVLTVTASRAGIDLGTATLCGIEIAWDDIRRTSGDEYLYEVAADLASDAIADARDALARLVAA